MEITIEEDSTLVASGRVSLPIPATTPDSFSARIRRLTAVFMELQQDYARFVAEDNKILGQERASLRNHCDEMIDAAIGALFHALVQINPDITNSEQEMTVPGEEKSFWIRRSGFLWHLRKAVQPSGSTDIRTYLKVISEWPLRRLLERIREKAEDKVIHADELRELLPDVLNLAMQLMELRQYINSCITSK